MLGTYKPSVHEPNFILEFQPDVSDEVKSSLMPLDNRDEHKLVYYFQNSSPKTCQITVWREYAWDMCMGQKSHASYVITRLGVDASAGDLAKCVLCGQIRPLTELTAGSVGARDEQGLACRVHAWNKADWLVAWARFEIEQQRTRGLASLGGEGLPDTSRRDVRYLEERPGKSITEQAMDIAGHLQVRQTLGTALVVVERPAIFLSMMRKQWMKISRVLQRERASTLDVPLINELSRQIAAMQSIRFVAMSPSKQSGANVYMVSPKELEPLSAGCKSVYLGCSLDNAAYERLFSQLPSGCVIVDYIGTADTHPLP